MSEHFADGSAAKEYVTQDDYTRSMAELGVDSVRTKADIIQIRDSVSNVQDQALKAIWLHGKLSRELYETEEKIKILKKKLLTTQHWIIIIAVLALLGAFI